MDRKTKYQFYLLRHLDIMNLIIDKIVLLYYLQSIMTPKDFSETWWTVGRMKYLWVKYLYKIRDVVSTIDYI